MVGSATRRTLGDQETERAISSGISSQAIIYERCHVGVGNEIHPFVVLGGPPQVKVSTVRPTSAPEDRGTTLRIGDFNVIREFVAINVGVTDAGTVVGSRNIIMSHCHIGHDASLASDCILGSHCVIAGHVSISHHARVGGNTAVAEWVRIGSHSFIGGHSGIDRDLPPFCAAVGNRPKHVKCCNHRGLRARFERKQMMEIRGVVSLWTDRRMLYKEALLEIERQYGSTSVGQTFLAFVAETKVGVLR